MNSLPKTVTRQGRDCDMNPGPSAPESSMLTTRQTSLCNKKAEKLTSYFDYSVNASNYMHIACSSHLCFHFQQQFTADAYSGMDHHRRHCVALPYVDVAAVVSEDVSWQHYDDAPWHAHVSSLH